MPDPIREMTTQFSQDALKMNRIASQMATQSINMMLQMNPLNVLANMAKGSGQYSMTTTSEELQSKNIFGGA